MATVASRGTTPLRVWLVRPHPPARVLRRRQPLREDYRYNWEPLTLKLLAYRLRQRFGAAVECTVWHLFDEVEDHRFIAACTAERPHVIAFSEIDLFVTEVNRLTLLAKRAVPDAVVIVGGKQTSLLQPWDRFPFPRVDFAIAGDGAEPLRDLCAALLEGRRPDRLPGMVRFDDTQVVRAVDVHGARDDLADIDGAALHEIAVRGHSLDDYLGREQVFPAPLDPPYRTATVLFATGCPHGCYFCQSSLEYAVDGGRVVQRDERTLADEIQYLHIEHDADAVFALAPNLSLGHLLAVYRALEERGVTQIPISGFVRAADIVAADRDGTLDALVSSGLRVLSVGLDLPYTTRDDRFGKRFDFETMEGALRACARCGIAVAATVVAPPDLTASELAETLDPLCGLPLCSVDVRIATAFRHTPYFESVEPHLRRHPDRDVGYFERQSYRYQTIRMPGRVRPRQTYRIVRRFTTRFERHPDHRRAVAALLDEHPALGPVFGLPGGGQDGAAAAYDPVADLYDKVFADIRVRRAEWRWVAAKVPFGAGLDVLDVGCGSGGLLRALSPRIASGTGVDVSPRMLDRARAGNIGDAKLRFESLGAGGLPFADASFDVVVSFLSLHYLRWPEAIADILRVLRPEGSFLCVDMVASQVAILELPQYVAAQASVVGQHLHHRRFAADLRELVRQPAWRAIERRYPLRPLSDYQRLAGDLGAHLEVLTVGKAAKVVAFAAQPGAKVAKRRGRSRAGVVEA